MRIALKDCIWERSGEDLLLVIDPREQITLVDPERHVEALLDELDKTPQSVTELCESLFKRGVSLTKDDVESGLAGLGSLGLIEDGDRRWFGDPKIDHRHFSNLAFFGAYADLERSRSDMVRSLRESHVLVLGVGGGGSSIVQSLAGLGIGRMTLVDRDDVESRNFARQFLYRHADIGRSKVERAAEWVREYDPAVEVRTVDRWISGPEDLSDLMENVDIIAGGIDGHPDAHFWVNEAAVRAGVPLVAGGMSRSLLIHYSVDPGKSPCLECDRSVRAQSSDSKREELAQRQISQLKRANRLIGPLAMHIGSLIAYETARYLTGFEPPRAVGGFFTSDIDAGLKSGWEPFFENPDCVVCAHVPHRAGALAVAK